MKILLCHCSFALIFFVLPWVAPGQEKEAAQNQNEHRAARVFEQWDKDQDERLSRDELPENVRPNFERVDKDGDGFISRKEHLAFLDRARNNRDQPAAQNGKSLPTGTIEHRDLPYVVDGHERQKLDLYLPAADEKPDAIVVWIHGGAWQAGDKQNCPARFLLADGFAVASVNYRLSQHATFPAQIEDCKAAIRFLREHAAEYQIDPERIGVWGSSAGGHLVALLGTSADVVELGDAKDITSSRVKAVCDYFGPIDFSLMNQQAGKESAIDHDAANSPESKLLGGAVQEHPAKVRLANPATYISGDDAAFLVVHGDQDRLVPVQQSKDFAVALEQAGLDAELIIVEGAGHGISDAKITQRVTRFFQDKLSADSQEK
jgi:acetyl esterase/lipase